jgi:hypothetical protein
MFQEFIVCTLLYIVAVAIAYQPRHTAPATETEPETPIDYFPTVEEPPAPEPEVGSAPGAPPKTTPKVITEPRPIAAYIPVKTTPMASESDLMTQSIRSLKSLAKGRVKRYSNLTKAQLSQRLAGIVPLSELT